MKDRFRWCAALLGMCIILFAAMALQGWALSPSVDTSQDMLVPTALSTLSELTTTQMLCLSEIMTPPREVAAYDSEIAAQSPVATKAPSLKALDDSLARCHRHRRLRLRHRCHSSGCSGPSSCTPHCQTV